MFIKYSYICLILEDTIKHKGQARQRQVALHWLLRIFSPNVNKGRSFYAHCKTSLDFFLQYVEFNQAS